MKEIGTIPDLDKLDCFLSYEAANKKLFERKLLYAIIFLYLDLIVSFLYTFVSPKKSLDALGLKTIKELERKLMDLL